MGPSGAPLALQLLVGMSQWEVLGEIRGRRREREMGFFIPLAALLLGLRRSGSVPP